jgi:hypothetical protein
MDVHPPHGPIRSWKDFTLHLLTITIGLLIALTLEAAVESMHHRHMVRDARANLRREIVENQRLYTENLHSLQSKLVQLERNIDQLRELPGRRGLYRQQTFVNEAGVSIFFDQAKAAAPLLTAKNGKDYKELLQQP